MEVTILFFIMIQLGVIIVLLSDIKDQLKNK